MEVEKTKDAQWFKVWCEEKDTKRKIWESRSKWEEKEMVVVEEWRSIAEKGQSEGN